MVSGAAAQLKELEKQQKARATRLKRDALDRALVDLASFYRDVLAVQVGADVELVNEEMRQTVVAIARAATARDDAAAHRCGAGRARRDRRERRAAAGDRGADRRARRRFGRLVRVSRRVAAIACVAALVVVAGCSSDPEK